MSGSRLSPLDASFLAVEEPNAHMHVGWHSVFAPPENRPRPRFEDLRDHIEARLALAPRYRQRLEEVPLGAHHPVWVDDPHFDIRRHVHRAPSADLDEVVADVMSEPLHRDRPLWEMWICEETDDGRVGLVGKAHHCMVDGLAAVELTSMLLDPTPEPAAPPAERAAPASRRPDRLSLLATAVRDRVAEPLRLLRAPERLMPTPEHVADAASVVERTARALTQAVGVPARPSTLNADTTPHRHLVRASRPLSDLQDVKRRFGATVNDVLLAATAGALRAFLLDRGEEPAPLKVMVPVSVRGDADGELGNRISFIFASLPCDEPEPRRRLESVAAEMRERKQAGEPEGADVALSATALMPRFLQGALAQVLASPRVFNLVVSNVPGPPVPLYLRGCRLEEAHPVVPLAAGHAVSIGMLTVAGKACFGLYADRRTVPDAHRLAGHLEAELDALRAQASSSRSNVPT